MLNILRWYAYAKIYVAFTRIIARWMWHFLAMVRPLWVWQLHSFHTLSIFSHQYPFCNVMGKVLMPENMPNSSTLPVSNHRQALGRQWHQRKASAVGWSKPMWRSYSEAKKEGNGKPPRLAHLGYSLDMTWTVLHIYNIKVLMAPPAMCWRNPTCQHFSCQAARHLWCLLWMLKPFLQQNRYPVDRNRFSYYEVITQAHTVGYLQLCLILCGDSHL